jgi:hypothetical protein
MNSENTFRVLRLIDHDQQYAFNQHQSGFEPLILNTFDLSDPNHKERLSELVSSNGSGADFIARCQCDNLEGNQRIGQICPICGAAVSPVNLLDDNNLLCRNWLTAPSELIYGWLTPKLYLALSNWLAYDKKKNNYLDDILDVTTPIPFELSDLVFGKGFTYLYENFDRIFEYFAFYHPVISKKPETQAMRLCIKANREKLFCRYIPVLNSAVNPIITDNSGNNRKRYSDTTADFILKATITLSRLEFSPKRKNRLFHVERDAFKAYKDIIAYTEDATSKYLSVKKAIPRMNIFGSRYHWSFRTVIVPITAPHAYYELHAPWKMAVNSLRVQIIGRLCDEFGANINDAIVKTRNALHWCDPDIHKLLNRFIEESPFPGIACVWDRPPSIRDGSVMMKFWTKIKPDLADSCISMTPMDVSLQNADFDGDNLAGIILPETDMVRAFKNLSPAAQIFDRNTGEVTENISVHKTCTLTINRFLGEI